MLVGMKLKLLKIVSAVVLTLSTGAVAVACGDGELGEECDAVGKGDGECEDGLVCARDSNGALLCLLLCEGDAQCPTDRSCNGIEGTSVKACRLKTK